MILTEFVQLGSIFVTFLGGEFLTFQRELVLILVREFLVLCYYIFVTFLVFLFFSFHKIFNFYHFQKLNLLQNGEFYKQETCDILSLTRCEFEMIFSIPPFLHFLST